MLVQVAHAITDPKTALTEFVVNGSLTGKEDQYSTRIAALLAKLDVFELGHIIETILATFPVTQWDAELLKIAKTTGKSTSALSRVRLVYK